MRNALVYHVASGQAFFSGVVLIHLAVLLTVRAPGFWRDLGRRVALVAGLALIAVSATPLPAAFYAAAVAITTAWVVAEGASRAAPWRRRLRAAVLVVWWVGIALELPFHQTPALPRPRSPLLYVVGDSLGAGLGGESTTWPRLLARDHGVVVRDLSRAGATVGSASRVQGEFVSEPGALVLAEIGGNDVLGSTTPEAFERGLDALLTRISSGGRTVVMLELPLPPFCNRYGAIQRRLARRHGARLVPKRLLLGVLTSPGSTLDSLHLSPSGHEMMAAAVWKVLGTAFEPATGRRTP